MISCRTPEAAVPAGRCGPQPSAPGAAQLPSVRPQPGDLGAGAGRAGGRPGRGGRPARLPSGQERGRRASSPRRQIIVVMFLTPGTLARCSGWGSERWTRAWQAARGGQVPLRGGASLRRLQGEAEEDRGEQVLQQGHHDRHPGQHAQHGHRVPRAGERLPLALAAPVLFL